MARRIQNSTFRVDKLKVEWMSITLVDELSAIRTSYCALRCWEELLCAAFTKSVPCQIVKIINNEKKLLEFGWSYLI